MGLEKLLSQITLTDILGPFGVLILLLAFAYVSVRWIKSLLADQRKMFDERLTSVESDLADCEAKHDETNKRYEVVTSDYNYLRGKIETIESNKSLFGALVIDITKSIGDMLDTRDKGKS